MNSILFLCTGNYYRSRIAEELFNFWARKCNLDWRADSAGLRENMAESPNSGPISEHATSMLGGAGFTVTSAERMPRSVTNKDLRANDLVICLYREEHEHVFESRFPDYDCEVLFWDVPDIGEMKAERAFLRIVGRVQQLVTIFLLSRSYIVTLD